MPSRHLVCLPTIHTLHTPCYICSPPLPRYTLHTAHPAHGPLYACLSPASCHLLISAVSHIALHLGPRLSASILTFILMSHGLHSVFITCNLLVTRCLVGHDWEGRGGAHGPSPWCNSGRGRLPLLHLTYSIEEEGRKGCHAFCHGLPWRMYMLEEEDPPLGWFLRCKQPRVCSAPVLVPDDSGITACSLVYATLYHYLFFLLPVTLTAWWMKDYIPVCLPPCICMVPLPAFHITIMPSCHLVTPHATFTCPTSFLPLPSMV